MSKILRLTEENVLEVAREAATVLDRGGLILYPTDTLYGLGVDPSSPDALANLYALKGRNEHKPVHSIFADIEMAGAYAHITPLAQKLADAFLPGTLTLILAAHKDSPYRHETDNSLGIRIPNNAFCHETARVFGKPFTATSANRSGEMPELSIEKILVQLGAHAELIDLIVDAGTLLPSLPTTVVDARGELPIILREGAISAEAIFATLT